MFICLTMEVIYVEFYKGLFCTYGLFFCGKYLMVWIVWWISGFSYPLVGLFRLLSYEELIVWRSCLMTFVMKQNQSLNCAIQQNIVKLFFFFAFFILQLSCPFNLFHNDSEVSHMCCAKHVLHVCGRPEFCILCWINDSLPSLYVNSEVFQLCIVCLMLTFSYKWAVSYFIRWIW